MFAPQHHSHILDSQPCNDTTEQSGENSKNIQYHLEGRIPHDGS